MHEAIYLINHQRACVWLLGLNDVKPLGILFRGMPPADRAYVIVALSVEAPQKPSQSHS